MQDASRISLQNRTGMQRSPVQSQELLDSVAEQGGDYAVPDPERNGLAEVRSEYLADAGPLGTMPAPLTPVGMARSAARMLAGDRLQVFVDKLAERAAFERGGTRLYDALLSKHLGELGADGHGTVGADKVSHETLLEFRNQEAEHFLLVSRCIERLGADPTAQTPGADVAGIQSMGLIQTVTDPRTSLVQSLSAILAAELVDGAGWELLVELARAMGQQEMAEDFKVALRHEAHHLHVIRTWHRQLVMADSGNPVEDADEG